MTRYQVIVNSFCLVGVCLSHINTPPCYRKSVFYTEKQVGTQKFFCDRDIKTHKQEIKFSSLPYATSSS